MTETPVKQPHLIPAAAARAEIRASNSRFIASIAPAASVEEARAFIATIRAEMPDASHHVFAYRIGHGAAVTHGLSDDGEPSGTAGRPILAVVQGSGLGDVVVVVTRYFGGTLLGTGGLVRAYGDATKAVLAVVPRSEPRATLTLLFPYSAYELVKRAIASHAGTIVADRFDQAITLTVTVPQSQQAACTQALQTITVGHVEVI